MGDRVMVRSAAVPGGGKGGGNKGVLSAAAAVGSSEEEWMAASVLQVARDRLLVEPQPHPRQPALPPRWIVVADDGIIGGCSIRPITVDDERRLAGLAAADPLDDECTSFEPDCLVDVEDEKAPTGWRAATVVERSSDGSGLYTLKYTDGDEVIDTTIDRVRHSSLRLRCCYEGCLKHALLMQRPPRDCDLCGRALQHPMRSYWEWTADMAQALRAGISSAQLCAACHKEAAAGGKGARGAPAIPQPRRGVIVDPSAVITIGQREIPLHAFTEVPIQRRRQLQAEEPEDSEQQNWVQCHECRKWYHWVCALYNQPAHAAAHARALSKAGGGTGGVGGVAPEPPPWHCRACRVEKKPADSSSSIAPPTTEEGGEQPQDFEADLDASCLPETDLSRMLQSNISTALSQANVLCEPVKVRVVSSIDLSAEPNDVMQQRQWSCGEAYPNKFPFRSRSIMALQEVDGHDVLLFMMYAQEYGDNCPEPNTKRVYISYVDSVKYFRSEPQNHRSTVYRTLLASYLQSCRLRGFRYVHIWVEPPRAGDEYIFYARPPDERKPMKREKLRSWYVKVLEKAKADGTVQRFGDMLDEFRDITSARQIPMFKGDQWEITVPAIIESKDEDGGEGGASSAIKEESPNNPLSSSPGFGSGGGASGGGGGGSSRWAKNPLLRETAAAAHKAGGVAGSSSADEDEDGCSQGGAAGARSLRLKASRWRNPSLRISSQKCVSRCAIYRATSSSRRSRS